MAGLARAAFDAFVWGAEMAPIEKLRDGRSSGLRWPSFERETQQPTERWCRREGGRWRGDANGRNAWARTFNRPFRRRIERREKIKIERAMGPRISMVSTGLEDATTN